MSTTALLPDPAAWIETVIQEFCAGSENNLQNGMAEKAWADPLVGYAGGADPLFEQYREVVGPYHWTPAEVFNLTFPHAPAEPGELTVICWILPQTEATKADNRRETRYPAERWARTRSYGEAFNVSLRRQLVQMLQAQGYPAVAPMIAPQWKQQSSERYVFSSNWSERHAAYAAGLGTFGLCDGLITPKGKAVRIGSVVARITIPPLPRPYSDHHAYCLFYSRGTCGKCIQRCPAGALSPAGHDKIKCQAHTGPVTSEYVKTHYGFAGYGCGLCQTGVPCESRIPGRTV